MRDLHGIRIVVTRGAHQAEELAAPLRDLGAEVILLPAISVQPPTDPGPLTQAAANCNQYDWVLFTSANAVEAFAAARPPDTTCNARIAAVGSGTAAHCQAHGFEVQLTPKRYVAESLVEAFQQFDLHDNRILIPSGNLAPDLVPFELRKLGALVNVVEAYRNELPPGLKAATDSVLREPYPDWILFASPSAVDNLTTVTDTLTLNRMRIASIGPVTTEAASQHGLVVTVEAAPHTAAGLVDAVVRCIPLIAAGQ